MAKVYMERAYIEAHDEEEDNFSILIHIKDGVNHVFAGKVKLDQPKAWIFLESNEGGDLIINNSAGMEGNKWDHITKEIIGSINE